MKITLKQFCFYIMVIISITGCQMFDMTKSESQKITGNIYLVNLHIPEQPGFFVVFQKKSGYEQHFLNQNESVDYIKANDSLLLIKTTANPNVAYYKIVHDKGENIVSVKIISGTDFLNYESTMVIKYNFISKENK